MKITAEIFRRLLPTLQHVARFPGCNRQAICKRDGVAVADVEAVIVEACGTLANWDEEYLAKLGVDLDVSIPAYKPNVGPRSAPVADSSPVPAANSPRLVAREPAPPSAAASTAGKWPWLKRSRVQRGSFEKHFPVLQAAAADPGATLSDVCKKAGVKLGAFYMFRSTYFAGVEVTPQHVEFFRRWATEKLGDRLSASLRKPASGTLADVLPASEASADDAVKALVALKVPAREAKARVAAIVDAQGLPANTGELVRLAMRNQAPRRRLIETTAATASAGAKRAPKTSAVSAPGSDCSAASINLGEIEPATGSRVAQSNGDLIATVNEVLAGFRLEVLTVRLVPAASGRKEVVEA